MFLDTYLDESFITTKDSSNFLEESFINRFDLNNTNYMIEESSILIENIDFCIKKKNLVLNEGAFSTIINFFKKVFSKLIEWFIKFKNWLKHIIVDKLIGGIKKLFGKKVQNSQEKIIQIKKKIELLDLEDREEIKIEILNKIPKIKMIDMDNIRGKDGYDISNKILFPSNKIMLFYYIGTNGDFFDGENIFETDKIYTQYQASLEGKKEAVFDGKKIDLTVAYDKTLCLSAFDTDIEFYNSLFGNIEKIVDNIAADNEYDRISDFFKKLNGMITSNKKDMKEKIQKNAFPNIIELDKKHFVDIRLEEMIKFLGSGLDYAKKNVEYNEKVFKDMIERSKKIGDILNKAKDALDKANQNNLDSLRISYLKSAVNAFNFISNMYNLFIEIMIEFVKIDRNYLDFYTDNFEKGLEVKIMPK